MFAPDKIKHIIVGFLMGIAIFAGGAWYFAWPQWQLAIGSFAAVSAVGLGFELFSKLTGYGHYEFLDAVVTALGGAAGIAIAWAII